MQSGDVRRRRVVDQVGIVILGACERFRPSEDARVQRRQRNGRAHAAVGGSIDLHELETIHVRADDEASLSAGSPGSLAPLRVDERIIPVDHRTVQFDGAASPAASSAARSADSASAADAARRAVAAVAAGMGERTTGFSRLAGRSGESRSRTAVLAGQTEIRRAGTAATDMERRVLNDNPSESGDLDRAASSTADGACAAVAAVAADSAVAASAAVAALATGGEQRTAASAATASAGSSAAGGAAATAAAAGTAAAATAAGDRQAADRVRAGSAGQSGGAVPAIVARCAAAVAPVTATGNAAHAARLPGSALALQAWEAKDAAETGAVGIRVSTRSRSTWQPPAAHAARAARAAGDARCAGLAAAAEPERAATGAAQASVARRAAHGHRIAAHER